MTGLIVPTKDVVIPPSPTPDSTSGCKDASFPAEIAGNVALVPSPRGPRLSPAPPGARAPPAADFECKGSHLQK